MTRKKHVLRCQDALLDLSRPRVMGILNVTEDSFYDGGRYHQWKQTKNRIDEMVQQGADIIDVGGMSSRPGAEEFSAHEEIERIKPSLLYLRESHPDQLVSVDTYRPEVMQFCLEHGAHIINDIRGGTYSEEVYPLVAQYRASYVMMHMRGDAKTMMKLSGYDNVTHELLSLFAERLQIAKAKGLEDVLIDPGVGFAKNIDQNYQLVRECSAFHALEVPILYGISRKSFLYKPAHSSPEEMGGDSAAVHLFLLHQGVHVLRVHDVALTRRIIDIAARLDSRQLQF